MSLLPSPGEWSPLEEQFHTWDVVLLNPDGERLVLSQWMGISITETHEGTRTQVEINAEEPSILHIRELISDFGFYRDHELLYRLRVVDSEDVLNRDSASVRFDCVSYDKLLERRILHEDWVLDDMDINAAWRLIDYTQRRYPLGITRGTTLPGVRRQRALDAGDDILTAINDFAQADGGFDWWIDRELRFQAQKPRRGSTHDTLWQLGGEIAELTRTNPIEDYSSLIMATGANSEVRIPRGDGNEDVYPPPDPQIVELPNKPFGLWEYTTSDTDVITEGSLMEKALWHLGDKGTIRPTYKLTIEPGVWTPGLALGDIFQMRIIAVRATVRVTVRIEELAITCSADGAEVVSLLVRAEKPEVPETPIGSPPTQFVAVDAPEPNGRTVQRHYLEPTDDLGALLRSLRKRLDRTERSRGIGGGAGSVILDGEGPPDCLIGSPGDYYVDRLDWRLFGPKAEAGGMVPPPVTWDFRELVTTPNDRLLNSEVGWVGYVYEDVDIVGFRFDGLTCGVTDSFDRADGALGADWVPTPTIPAYNDQNFDLTIVGQNAVGSTADVAAGVPRVGNTMRWATAQPTDSTQAIEISANFGSSGGTFYLFTNANASNSACMFVECTYKAANFGVPGNLVTTFTVFHPDGTSETESENLTAYFQSMNRFRLESDPDGTQRLYWDNTQYTTTGEYSLLKTWNWPAPVVGPYVGFGTTFGAGSPQGYATPKFNAITVGCPGAGIIGADRPPPASVSGDLTVSIWDWDRRELLFRTTAPAAGTDWVEIPPVRFKVRGGVGTTGASQRWCVSIGGAAVPVHNPGQQFIYDSYPSLVASYGAYTGPVGSSPETSSGYFGPMPLLYVKFQSQTCLAATPEDFDPFTFGIISIEPDTLISGEIGKIVSVSNRGYLLGWRYKRMAGQSSPLTWTVWDWEYRYYSEVYANVKPFSTGVITQIVDDHTGEGEFEVRLPTPILMDPFGREGPETVVISAGGEAIGIDTSTSQAETNQYSAAGWYNYHFGTALRNPVIGDFPQDGIGSYPNYPAWPMNPIMQQGDVPAWPTTDLKRSGSVADPEGMRAELHRNIGYATSGVDLNGLRFYQGGPSHDDHGWGPGEGVPWWSAGLSYDGYSGMEFSPDDWYDEEYGVVWPTPNRYTNKWAYYDWYYDYQYYEIWADLDTNNPYWPGGSFGMWQESGAWDDDCYWTVETEGVDHTAGFHAESSGISPMTEGGVNETTAIATMHASSFDGIGGTQLSVTPRVIQACFQPEGTYNTWWYGDGSAAVGLTPKGCVMPLITAASATATAADEPWQKQFFRQIGLNTIAFNAGVGTIPVPTGMGLPAVVNAQVDGVTAGGIKVAQARRTSDNAITVALDTALDGDLAINWSVDAAAITFGTPPPSIDAIRNPGSSYAYGPYVEYDAGGGVWPFELVSWGSTFVDGCVLKDFTGATVGGPFTPETIPGSGYQRILWNAGRNWYLPGQTQQYRMTNPDGQTSSWNVLTWYEADVFAATLSDSALRTVAPRIAEEQPEGLPASPARYANNPRLRAEPEPRPPDEPVVQPLTRGPDSPRERRQRLSPTERKQQRQARQERQRQERAAKQAKAPAEEPPTETTGQ